MSKKQNESCQTDDGRCGLSEAEFTEREMLLELQRNSQRWLSQEEFNRLKELSNKMFANAVHPILNNTEISKTKTNKMSELKTEHLVYMSDETYTPISYKGVIVKQPFFKGKGNHSVAELEAICEQFKEYVHQQQIIKQNCMKHIVELKFGVSFPSNDA